jgi:hypothetical protein
MSHKPVKKPVKSLYYTKHYLRTFINEMWSADIEIASKTINPKPLLLSDVTSYQFYDLIFSQTGDKITASKPKGFTKLKDKTP